MSDASAVLQRLDAQLQRGYGRGSRLEQVGSFRLHLWTSPDPFYRNVALPVAPAEDWDRAVADLIAGFCLAGREPRLEFFAELWPGLALALERAGLQDDGSLPVLMLDRAPGMAVRREVTILGPQAPARLSDLFLQELQATFSQPFAADADTVTRFRQEVASGASRPALVLDKGRPIAGACLIGVGAEAELAGVWTSPAHRRRGFATAACATLLRDFFSRGGELVWLSTAEHGSEALYRKLGFRRVGTQCNYVWPAGIPLPLQSSAA